MNMRLAYLITDWNAVYTFSGILLGRTSFPVIVHFYYCEISQSYKPIKNNTLNLQCHLKSIYLSGLFPYTLIETLPAIPSERVLLLSFLFVR